MPSTHDLLLTSYTLISIIGVLYFFWTRQKKVSLFLTFSSPLNISKMPTPQTITLPDLNAHTVLATVTDQNGNVYKGTLAFTAATPADATQDTVEADPKVANTLDVQAETQQGGTSVAVTAQFTSQGNSVPAAGSNAITIPDGEVLTVPGTFNLVNNAVPQLGLSFALVS